MWIMEGIACSSDVRETARKVGEYLQPLGNIEAFEWLIEVADRMEDLCITKSTKLYRKNIPRYCVIFV